MSEIKVVTLDGPAASGKGTVARLLAQRLGFHYLDSGLLYRMLGWVYLQKPAKTCCEAALVAKLAATDIAFEGAQVIWAGQDITPQLRSREVSMMASKVAAFPQVRQALLSLQRACLQAPGIVADGRDMGSVVFPQAAFKLFLTASVQVRAWRRATQLFKEDIHDKIAEVSAAMVERDRADRDRLEAPLLIPACAVLLDNSYLDVDQTVHYFMQSLQKRRLV